MAEVTVRDLRNHGGEVLDRVLAGEEITVTRSGTPIADLVRHRAPGVVIEVLFERWRHLPHVDAVGLRADLDEIVDATL
jgi:antitoxin (DNA-binding transcriptional repressor) of toxin-antitoxin stability system